MRLQFQIHGASAECVAGEVEPAVAAYWHKAGGDALQKYMECDPDSRVDGFDVPDEAQIDVEWTDLDDEVHLNGPLVDEKSVLVIYNVDEDREVLRVPLSEVRILVEEQLTPDETYEGELDDAELNAPPYFKAVAYGKGCFITEPIELDVQTVSADEVAISVFKFTDDVMVVQCIGVDDDLQDLGEDSGRTNSMSCWID